MKTFFLGLFLFLCLFVLTLFVFEVQDVFWAYLVNLFQSRHENWPAFLMGLVYSLLYLIPLIQNVKIKREIREENRESKKFVHKAVAQINFFFFLAVLVGYLLFSFGSLYLLQSQKELGGVLIALSIISFFVYALVLGNKLPTYFRYKKAVLR